MGKNPRTRKLTGERKKLLQKLFKMGWISLR